MGEIRKQEVCKLAVLRFIYIKAKATSLQMSSWRMCVDNLPDIVVSPSRDNHQFHLINLSQYFLMRSVI